jgi:hypothetical protein
MVRSNLGQTWSSLVKLGQTWSKLSKLLEMYPRPHFKGSRVRWVLVGLETARSNLGQTLVNSSQTWSTLVKLGQTWSKLSKLLEMYPRPHFKGSRVRWVLVGLETARSNLGQTLVNSSQTWSTLVKLGQTLGNVSRTFFLGVLDAMRPHRNRPT